MRAWGLRTAACRSSTCRLPATSRWSLRTAVGCSSSTARSTTTTSTGNGLKVTGVRFRGHSDTEVLVELIARRGPEAAVAAVDGMFALGAWDRQERVLVLARDRLGEKPLYYGRVGGAFAFASELRAIRRLPRCPTEPDPQALGEYLRFGFVPSPLSILPGIHKLPPGTSLRVSARGEAGTPTPYWSLVDVARAGLAAPLSAPTTSSSTSPTRPLRRSVERRIEADVPVGAFLSGGVGLLDHGGRPGPGGQWATGAHVHRGCRRPGTSRRTRRPWPDTWAPTTPRCPSRRSMRSTSPSVPRRSTTSPSQTLRAMPTACCARRRGST